MGPSDSKKIVAGAVMPRFTTASATRSSSKRSSLVNASASILVANAWDSSSRTLPYFPAKDFLEKEAITVWKGSRIYYRAALYGGGGGGVNQTSGMVPV